MSDTDRPIFGGRYELHRRIARGGMAEVFLARDQLLDRPVAVKVLFPEYATDPSFVERFRREAQAAANLNQPNVVSVYDWGQEAGTYYIVMEYVEGRSLAEIIRAEGPLHPDRAADIASDIASALSFAHRNGVVHRDIKPGNVLINNAGQVKVTDFGIARAIAGSPADNLTQAGAVMGTATYLSPEQAQGQPADPRSDVYSLSVVLYEMVTAGPPFTGETPVAIAYKHVQEEPVPPSRYNSDVPAELEAICLHGLSKEAANRYESAEAFRGDLRRFRTGHHVLALGRQDPALSEGGESSETGGAAIPAPTSDFEASIGGPNSPTGSEPTQMIPGQPPPIQPPPGGLPPQAEPPPDRTALWIGLLVMSLIAVGALVFLLIRSLGDDGSQPPATTTDTALRVPQVVGMDWEQAQVQLTDLGFEHIIIAFEEKDDVPENEVFAQSPRSGVLLADPTDPNDPVNLFVSEGIGVVRVPSVEGRPVGEAEEILNAAGFTVDLLQEVSEDVAKDFVIRQSVPSTEERPQGTIITLTVSVGRGDVEIPNLIGSDVTEARVQLAREGLLDEIVSEFSTEFIENTVIRTEPIGLETVEKGSVVRLIVSKGPEKGIVPTLDQLGTTDPDQVSAALIGLGFDVLKVDREIEFDNPADGQVIDFDPTPGSELVLGSQVIIVIGRAGEPPATTTTTTTTVPITTTVPVTTTTAPDG